MGTSIFADRVLSSLLEENYNIISVYTRPDKKIGRKRELQKSPVKITAGKKSIPVFTPDKLDEGAVLEIKSRRTDIIVVADYGKILPKTILEIPGFGAINVHASLLPKYRGPSPIQNAILNGDAETGTTIMLMDEGVDTGDILSQRPIAINKDETYLELSKKMAQASAELLLKTIPTWVEQKITPRKQVDSKATLCQLIERQDGKIIWTDEAESIYNCFRAFCPWPGIFTFWERNNSFLRLKLNKISLLKNNPETKRHTAEVFRLEEKIGVQTTSGIIILEEIQLEGKPGVKIEDFINGYPDFIGSILK